MARLRQNIKSYSNCPYMVKEVKYKSARWGSNTGSLSSKRKLIIHIPMGRILTTKLIFNGETKSLMSLLSTALISPDPTWWYLFFPKCFSLQLAFSSISTQADSSHASEFMWALEFTKHCTYPKHGWQTGSILSSENWARNAESQVCLRSAKWDCLAWYQQPVLYWKS